MIKKIIQAVIWKLLMAELRIRGRHIKPRAWRDKMVERVDDITNFDLRTLYIRMLVSPSRKIAYMENPKTASTSILTTLYKKKNLRIETKRKRVSWKKSLAPAEREEKLHRLNRGLKKLQSNILLPYHKGIMISFDVKDIRYLSSKGKWIFLDFDEKNGFIPKMIAPDEVNSYFIFTFVRNPFTRFVSFFQQKYKNIESRHFYTIRERNTFFQLKKILSFDDLAHKIYKIPDYYLEIHTFSQSFTIDYFSRGSVHIDFIGKFENLEEEFEPIRQRFGLLPLEHRNKSSGEKKDWRDYYTPKTAKLIYERYRRDFEMFGYEDEYPKLLEYLKSRAK